MPPFVSDELIVEIATLTSDKRVGETQCHGCVISELDEEEKMWMRCWMVGERERGTCPFSRPHVPPGIRSVTGFWMRKSRGRNSTGAPRASPITIPNMEPAIRSKTRGSIFSGTSRIIFSKSCGFLMIILF